MQRSYITKCRLAGVDPVNSVGRVGRNKQIIQISTYSPLKLWITLIFIDVMNVR